MAVNRAVVQLKLGECRQGWDSVQKVCLVGREFYEWTASAVLPGSKLVTGVPHVLWLGLILLGLLTSLSNYYSYGTVIGHCMLNIWF